MLQLAQLVREAFRGDALPGTRGIEHLPPREGDIRASACNPAKLFDALGFSPRYTVEAGLAATVRWFRELRSK